VIAIKLLKVDKVYSSPITVASGGTIMTRGGRLPLPAPAALYLLKGMPLVYINSGRELVTPTGAALLAGLVEGFSGIPNFTLAETGCGAGSNNTDERPNCLRALIGETAEAFIEDSIYVIEANIDDMNPVDYEQLTETLFKEGALDVYLVAVQMKKTRPGVLLTILAAKEDLDKLSGVIFKESTTIGIRYHEVSRKKLKRDFVTVKTRFGNIKVKVSTGPKGINKAIPEYEDCKRLAMANNIPVSRVRSEASTAIARSERYRKSYGQ
ncbi:MAG: LarC family nickel insertion protein, partial [Candidatus Omnitrophota bacterium]